MLLTNREEGGDRALALLRVARKPRSRTGAHDGVIWPVPGKQSKPTEGGETPLSFLPYRYHFPPLRSADLVKMAATNLSPIGDFKDATQLSEKDYHDAMVHPASVEGRKISVSEYIWYADEQRKIEASLPA